MKKVFPSGQFKKDYKRYRNQPKKIEALKVIVDMLINEEPIPSIFRPHMLRGNNEGCMECHILGNFLLFLIEHPVQVLHMHLAQDI